MNELNNFRVAMIATNGMVEIYEITPRVTTRD